MGARNLHVADLGLVAYGDALERQRALAERRIRGEVPDTLLLLEHPPVITLGRGTRQASLPVDPESLRRRGIAVFEIERGGDVTYHGPGQLVGYPVLDLQGLKPDLHWYLRQLEEVLIGSLATFDIRAERNPGYTGVWTGDRKIASIGIHVRQWVTWHGFALNVTTDLSPFDLIVPCGIPNVRMTSVQREMTGRRAARASPPALMQEVRDAVVGRFARTFGYDGAVAGTQWDNGTEAQWHSRTARARDSEKRL